MSSTVKCVGSLGGAKQNAQAKDFAWYVKAEQQWNFHFPYLKCHLIIL